VANFVYIEYKQNIKIHDNPPSDYWPKFIKDLSQEEINQIYDIYSLPSEFPNMEYFDFLKERRKLIASKIRKYFNSL
jgi:hypothetical protein